MRGITTVIVTTFSALLLFGIFAPAVIEPIADVVTSNAVVQDHRVDADGIATSTQRVTLVWGPLLFIAGAVAFAIRWYIRRERVGRRVR